MASSARRIVANNPDLTQSEKTQLDADYTSGTTLTVISNFGFQDNDIVVVGNPGIEKSEASDVTGTTANTTIDISSGLKFDHQAGTQIFRSEYDQVEFSVMVSGGSWVVLDTVGIKWDGINTIFINQGGVDSDSYRFRFKNSVANNTSEYSPTILGSGPSKDSVGYMIQNIRKEVNDPKRKIVSDAQIIRFLNMAKDMIRAKRQDWWFWEKEDLDTITTVADQRKYNLDDISTLIEFVRDIRLRDTSIADNVQVYQLLYITRIEYDAMTRDENETGNDSLFSYTLLPPDGSSTAGYFTVDPKPLTTGNGSFRIRYYAPEADFDDVADTTSIGLPNILGLFAVAQIERMKGNDERAGIFEKLFNGTGSQNRDRSQLTGMALLEQMQINRLKPTSQPRSIKRFRGRSAVTRLYGSSAFTNRDFLAETYFAPFGRGGYY